MARLGFSHTYANHATFVKKSIIILVYVNNISIFIITRELMNLVKNDLLLAYSIIDISPIQEYLNIEIK
jgi:hypothetical protein